MKVVVHGAGPAGCTAARLLAEQGHEVTILEIRNHIAGNAYDYSVDGVLIHKYGPHLFHTNDKDVVAFLSRFTKWKPYIHKVKAITSEGIISLPIYDKQLIEDVSVTEHYADPYYYDLVYRDYSLKQWGYQPPKEVLDRVMIKHKEQEGYFTDTFQALPLDGYTAMFAKMLNHKNITVELSVHPDERPDCDLRVWTGPADEYYGFTRGELCYRSLNFDIYKGTIPLEAVTVNNCTLDVPYTRVTDYNMMHNIGIGWRQAEFPLDHIRGVNEPYYPVGENFYEGMKPTENCILLGRLAEFKYYDMDKIIAKVIKEIKCL